MPAASLTPLKGQLAGRIAACVRHLNLRQVEAAEMLELTQLDGVKQDFRSSSLS